MSTTNDVNKSVKVIRPLTLSELAVKAEAQTIHHFGLNEECTRDDLLQMPVADFNKLLHFSEEVKSMDKYPGYMRHILLQRLALQQEVILQQNKELVTYIRQLIDKCPRLASDCKSDEKVQNVVVEKVASTTNVDVVEPTKVEVVKEPIKVEESTTEVVKEPAKVDVVKEPAEAKEPTGDNKDEEIDMMQVD